MQKCPWRCVQSHKGRFLLAWTHVAPVASLPLIWMGEPIAISVFSGSLKSEGTSALVMGILYEGDVMMGSCLCFMVFITLCSMMHVVGSCSSLCCRGCHTNVFVFSVTGKNSAFEED